MRPNPFSVKNICITFTLEKGSAKTFNFQITAQRRQSPNRRKFAKSGHLLFGSLSRKTAERNLPEHKKLTFSRPTRIQSYDFRIYSYNAGVVVGYLHRAFFKVKENMFVFITH
jgi:hypothetical protein